MCNLIFSTIMGTLLVLGCTGAYAQEIGRDLSEILDSDGRICAGITEGSFNTSGYRMQLTPDGSPVFTSSPLDSNWDNRFGELGVSGRVYAIAVSDSYVYAGGLFHTAGGVSANCIAKWDGSSWSALGSGVNGEVWAIAVSGNDVYVGGIFSTAGGDSVNRIAKWNGTSWSDLGGGVNKYNSYVWAIAVNGNDVYVGGYFTTAGGVSAKNIAKWNGSSWSSLGSGVNNVVTAIAVSSNDIYVGGGFSIAGEINANKIAKWDGSSWTALGSGMNATVWALGVSGNNVYAGGYFTMAGGVITNYIAKWNGTTWSALSNWLNDWVFAIAINDTDVYVGGTFYAISGIGANRIAKWNGSSWKTLGSGVDSAVKAISVSGSDVYAGGYFTTAGEKLSYHFGIYHNVPAGVEGKPIIINHQPAFRLEQNRPNPFLQGTIINYQLPKAGQVCIKVYNIVGQVVKTLVNEAKSAGTYNTIWDGRDNTGTAIANGIYFCRLEAGGFKATKKMVVLK